MEKQFGRLNIFITGATSFLGRNTCSYLIKKGYNVFAFARENSENNYKLNNIKGLNIIPINIDNIIEEEIDRFNSICNKYKIIIDSINKIRNKNNVFIHYAWKGTSRLDRQNKDIQEYNLLQSKKWLKIAKILGVKKFIFAGSQAEYSENNYGIYKNKFAEYAKEYINNEMEFIHMRIFSVFGSDDRSTTILSSLLSSIKEKKDFDMTSCQQKWNFLYIDDYVKILELIIKKSFASMKCGLVNFAPTLNNNDFAPTLNNNDFAPTLHNNDFAPTLNDNMVDMDIASDETRVLRDYIIEAHGILKSKIKLNFGVKEENNDVFAIPDISNLIKYIGDFKYMKFADAVKDMYRKM